VVGGVRRAALTAAACAALVPAACGGSHGRAAAKPSAATVSSADCAQWKALDPAARRELVKGLRAFFVQRLDSGAHERVPADAHAYRLITGYCRLPFARAFLLYRLYGNAAGFSGG
jgi:hypothetical protein